MRSRETPEARSSTAALEKIGLEGRASVVAETRGVVLADTEFGTDRETGAGVPPTLPHEIVEQTGARYAELIERLGS